jgi:hypothetical protein
LIASFDMPRSPVLALLFAIILATKARGEELAPVPLVGETVVMFATREEGIAVLTARDGFAEQLSKFDLQSRL